MRAVLVAEHGPPDVLKLAELDVPRHGPDQVRVRVRAAGIQPFDTYVRQGRPGFAAALPHQLGNEFSGIVDAVGSAVTGWSEGDAVLGWAAMTSLAEYVIADTAAIVAKPQHMPWDTAGTLSASGQTACTALRELHVGAGDTLLVHAAAGGAGSATVQLARHLGARVIGTASKANHGYLTSLGAIPVAYGAGLANRVRTHSPYGVDAALDAIGGQALRDSLALVPDKNRIATLVDHDLADELGVRGIRAQRSTEQLRAVVAAWRSGALRSTIRATFPLDEIADAHREVEHGHGAGKVVVTIPPTP